GNACSCGSAREFLRRLRLPRMLHGTAGAKGVHQIGADTTIEGNFMFDALARSGALDCNHPALTTGLTSTYRVRRDTSHHSGCMLYSHRDQQLTKVPLGVLCRVKKQTEYR